jgi:hypothetical protein
MNKAPIHTSTACNAPVTPGNAEKQLPARRNALPNVADLLAHHGMLLQGNEHCYFELAYIRQTGWMAFICDRPAQGTIGTPEFGAGRKIIARGQGDTPDAACANALLALGARA